MRFLAISSLLLTATLTVSAQLKVNSDGKVRIGEYTSHSNYKINLLVGSSSSSGKNIGVLGKSVISGNNGAAACGVYGMASNDISSGMCYGVAGALLSNTYGAGVMGGAQDIMGYQVLGRYAGYFLGNFDVIGSVTAPSIIQPSDSRLNDNITILCSRGESTLNKLLNMNVVEYNYKPLIPSMKLPDSVSVEKVLKSADIDIEKKHFGLIAQELQTIYPELVVKGQDGYLGINYVELVPILIRSIQELKAELDEVKGKSDDTVKSRAAAFEEEETTGVGDATNIPAMATLAQNTPNPFSERTSIRFTLPENAQNAFIYIFDMSGKMQKQIPVTPDMQSVTIEGYELRAGMYIYSLVIGGKEVQTRRMILSK